MLDQLKNIDDPDMMLAPSEYMVNHAAVNRLSAPLGCQNPDSLSYQTWNLAGHVNLF
jgi:hypothetical protein